MSERLGMRSSRTQAAQGMAMRSILAHEPLAGLNPADQAFAEQQLPEKPFTRRWEPTSNRISQPS